MIRKRIQKRNFSYINDLLKNTIWTFCNFHKGEKGNNIMIFTSGRSGGTWLGEMIACTKGVKFVLEPLSVEIINNRTAKKIQPLQSGNNFINETIDLEILKTYFDDIIAGKLNIQNPWRINRPYFNIFTNRTVFKICKALPLINWFFKNFNERFVYLVRHPIASALSMRNKSFDFEINGYLENDYFINKYIGPDLLDYCHHINEKGTVLQKYNLRWALENIAPYKEILEGNATGIIVISYENLVTNPLSTIKYLSDNLDLNMERMVDYLSFSSATTKKSFSTVHYSKGSPIIKGWKDKISKKERMLCGEILKKFEVFLYDENNFLLKNNLLTELL